MYEAPVFMSVASWCMSVALVFISVANWCVVLECKCMYVATIRIVDAGIYMFEEPVNIHEALQRMFVA